MAPFDDVGPTALLIAGLLLMPCPATATGSEPAPGSAVAAQEGEPPPPAADTLPETPADTLEQEEPPPAVLPDRLRSAGAGFSRVVAEWDRQELLDETAPSLMGLLSRELPGLTSLRAEYFTGPHRLQDGILGPGFVRVRLDGREMSPLRGGAVDLSRISLAMLGSVRVLRRPDGVVVEATTLRREEPEAYSRIEGATGDPDIDMIRGIFTNGFQRNLDVAAAIDFFNMGAGAIPSNRFDAWGRLGWIPGDRDAGLELWWRSESIERVLEGEANFQRGEIFLHGRAELLPGIQADLWAGTEEWEPSDAEGVGADPEEAEPAVSVTQAELSITAVGDRAYLETGVRTRSGGAHAGVATRLSGGVRVLPGVILDAAADLEIWEDFVTSSAGAGLSLRPEIILDPRLRLGASSGSRGLPRPGGESPVAVDFRSLVADGSIELGPYRLSERIAYQDLDAQHPFGDRLDIGVPAIAPAELLSFETRLAGPPLPFSDFLESFRLEGVYRFQRRLSPGNLLYTPRDLLRGELSFRRSFFEENLQVELRGGAGYRGTMLSARTGSTSAEALPSNVTTDAGIVIRIDTFRLFWRADNMLRRMLSDYVGLQHPVNPYVFGVKWEFSN